MSLPSDNEIFQISSFFLNLVMQNPVLRLFALDDQDVFSLLRGDVNLKFEMRDRQLLNRI